MPCRTFNVPLGRPPVQGPTTPDEGAEGPCPPGPFSTRAPRGWGAVARIRYLRPKAPGPVLRESGHAGVGARSGIPRGPGARGASHGRIRPCRRHIAVIGVGNDFRHDDGVAWSVIARLEERSAERPLPPGTALMVCDGDAARLLCFGRAPASLWSSTRRTPTRANLDGRTGWNWTVTSRGSQQFRGRTAPARRPVGPWAGPPRRSTVDTTPRRGNDDVGLNGHSPGDPLAPGRRNHRTHPYRAAQDTEQPLAHGGPPPLWRGTSPVTRTATGPTRTRAPDHWTHTGARPPHLRAGRLPAGAAGDFGARDHGGPDPQAVTTGVTGVR